MRARVESEMEDERRQAQSEEETYNIEYDYSGKSTQSPTNYKFINNSTHRTGNLPDGIRKTSTPSHLQDQTGEGMGKLTRILNSSRLDTNAGFRLTP